MRLTEFFQKFEQKIVIKQIRQLKFWGGIFVQRLEYMEKFVCFFSQTASWVCSSSVEPFLGMWYLETWIGAGEISKNSLWLQRALLIRD